MANIDYKQEAKDALFCYIVDLDRNADRCMKMIRKFPQDAPRLATTNRYPLKMDENGEILKDCAYWYTLKASIDRDLNEAASAYRTVFAPNMSTDSILDSADEAIEKEVKGGGPDDGHGEGKSSSEQYA